jgi:lipid II:glycine glycyltransferase (peptidoglycan interpeptide bridge formation enzyme)
MKLDVAPKQTDHLVPTPLVHQTAFWGRVNRRLGHGTEAYDLAMRTPAAGSDTARGDFLVVRRRLSNDIDCAYVPSGPELAPESENVGSFLERLSRELQPLLGSRCAFIRWDLPWLSLHARDPEDFGQDGKWSGPPSTHAREIRMNMGTEDRNLWKSPRDLLPADTVLVDLADSEDAILARMHHKTRYNIRLAERQGVVVSEGTVADLPAWYDLYVATMSRNQLTALPCAHFQAMLEERGEGSASPVQTRLLLAWHDGQLLAGMLLALAPARATYLYGGSTRESRHLMAPSALQWAAIRTARAHGCLDYDMLGAAPRSGESHPLAGVHRFKVGFGGHLVHREGCWDFPFNEKTYTAWRGFEQAELVAGRAIRGE